MSQCQQFQVESESLHEHSRHYPGQHLAFEQFHAGLRIPYGQADQHLHYAKVDGAHEATMPRIRDHRVGVALGAGDDVRILSLHDVEKGRDAGGVEVEIRVEEQHVVAGRRLETAHEGGALAHVLAEILALHRRQLVRSLLDRGFGVICAAIIDHHYFNGELAFEDRMDFADVADKTGRQIMRRHNDAEDAVADLRTRRLPRVALTYWCWIV